VTQLGCVVRSCGSCQLVAAGKHAQAEDDAAIVDPRLIIHILAAAVRGAIDVCQRKDD
jgi:hypothetical protein